jgi:hypothetical protein
MPIADVMRHSADAREFSLAQLDEVMRAGANLMARGEPFRLERRCRTGACSA